MMRNKITFEKYKLKSPVSIIFTVAAFLKFWAGLFKNDDKEAIIAGAEQLLEATKLMMRGGRATDDGAVASSSHSGLLMITEG